MAAGAGGRPRQGSSARGARGNSGLRVRGRVILDSSVVLAVLLREPGHEHLLDLMAAEGALAIGAPTVAETGIVLTARLGPSGLTLLARFVQEAGIEIVPFGDDHWQIAVDAFRRFGKGRHPASLNFGDCLT